MEITETSAETKPLLAFCEQVISRHKQNWPPSEEVLAKEFVEQFQATSWFGSEKIAQLSSRLGIVASLAALPEGMHGLNCSTETETRILLKEEEGFPGSREHTFFHELREILEYSFRDLGWPTVDASKLEQHAERFAVTVRLVQSSEMAKYFVESVDEVEATWKRVLVCVVVIVFMVSWGLGCALLPYLEDKLPPNKQLPPPR